MQADPKRGDGRRRFLTGAARVLALVGLGGVAARLVAGRTKGLAKQACDYAGGCRRCRALRSCGLPQAMSARRLESRLKQNPEER
jgi:hypothetical protein